MLPVELLRHIFSFAIDDIDCLDTFGCQTDVQTRYKLEECAGRKEIQTKQALMLVCSLFHTIVEEYVWHWIAISSYSRLQQVDLILRQSGEYYKLQLVHKYRRRRPARWIKRIDIRLTMFHSDNPKAVRTLMTVLTSCPNLRVVILDTSGSTAPCRPISGLILGALRTLDKIRRLNFLGCKGPTLRDVVNLLPHLKYLEQLDTGNMEESRLEEKEVLRALGIRDGHSRVRSEEQQDGKSGRGRKLSFPRLYALQISSRPQSSWLTLFNHTNIPSLTRLTLHHIDFQDPPTRAFFHNIGSQLTHVYTTGIHTSDTYAGFSTLLSFCSNLHHLSFSPRYSHHQYGDPWKHDNLRSIGLRHLLNPEADLDDSEIQAYLKSSIMRLIMHISKSRSTDNLAMMATMQIEDGAADRLKREDFHGVDWEVACQSSGLRVEDMNGDELVAKGSTCSPEDLHTDSSPDPLGCDDGHKES